MSSKKHIERRLQYLKKYNKGGTYTSDVEDLDKNAARYLRACRESRLMCVIDKVAPSGMSRTMKFMEMRKGRVFNFFLLFQIAGYKPVGHTDYFRISGCGMDMVFHTHYTLIGDLYYLGYLSQKQCDELSQNTPHKL